MVAMVGETAQRNVFALVMLGILAIALAVAANSGFNSSDGSNMAPPYEEIQETIFRITKRDINPQGPEVGLDGLVDPGIEQAWRDYNGILTSKRVTNWRGWYRAYTEAEPGIKYTLSIAMEESRVNKGLPQITMHGVPTDQFERLKSWDRGQPIVFSGTIEAVLWDGQIWLYYTAIDPGKTPTSR